MRKPHFVTLMASLPLALAACANFADYAPKDIHPGQTFADVTQQLGKPTNEYALPGGGKREEFARGPYGRHTFMVDMDATGHVMGWTQVLTPANFYAVQPGESRDELLLSLGRPSDVRPGGWPGGVVWSYRYDDERMCQWYQISLDDAGKVTSSSFNTDPHCDAGGNDHGHS